MLWKPMSTSRCLWNARRLVAGPAPAEAGRDHVAAGLDDAVALVHNVGRRRSRRARRPRPGAQTALPITATPAGSRTRTADGLTSIAAEAAGPRASPRQ